VSVFKFIPVASMRFLQGGCVYCRCPWRPTWKVIRRS